MVFHLPSRQDRTSVIGSTGEGKTQFSLWLLSHSYFDEMPYIIFDYKRDPLIAELGTVPGVEQVGYKEHPKQPGVYILRPDPGENDLVEEYLYNVWRKERTGLYFDEAYMLPNSGTHGDGAYKAILTQGRSKFIPAIILTQRPSHILSFTFSEAQHRAVFYLNHAGDRKKIAEFFPPQVSFRKHLPKYHSWWYSSGEREAIALSPVPGVDVLLEQIASRIGPRQQRRRVI